MIIYNNKHSNFEKLLNKDKGRYTYGVHENCLIFKTPQPLPIYVQNFPTPDDLGRLILNKPPPPHPNLSSCNKLQSNNSTMYVNERNQNKSKTKSRHIQIDHTFYFSILPTNNAMVSLKNGFTV